MSEEKENVITLVEPLKVNGKDLTELTYDLNQISINDMAEIERERSQMLGPQAATVIRIAQNDNLMHILICMHAIMKCNPEIDINDLKRIKGYDITQLATAGFRFFTKPATPDLKSSEKPQEDIQEDTTARSKNSVTNPLQNS